MHNKLLIIDPLGEHPVIVVGSANLSEPSIDANDENMLVIKGINYRREMDIYLTEFIRLFDHFNFREWLNSSEPGEFDPFLEEHPEITYLFCYCFKFNDIIIITLRVEIFAGTSFRGFRGFLLFSRN